MIGVSHWLAGPRSSLKRLDASKAKRRSGRLRAALGEVSKPPGRVGSTGWAFPMVVMASVAAFGCTKEKVAEPGGDREGLVGEERTAEDYRELYDRFLETYFDFDLDHHGVFESQEKCEDSCIGEKVTCVLRGESHFCALRCESDLECPDVAVCVCRNDGCTFSFWMEDFPYFSYDRFCVRKWFSEL